MKPGQASRTAVMVCAARAAAHGRFAVGRFSDPTAMALLPDDARAEVERFHAGAVPRSGKERFAQGALEARARMMVVRTVAIDDAVREAACPQVVILGAGLDGRAWRMPELREATVFEVDHPDSQRMKRDRVAGLSQTAREVRFVPVDFTRDDLARALADAGHDPARPTTWIWEGVVMYLTREEVEATLAIVARRSAKGSRLAIAYHAPALMLWFVGAVLRRVGEPLKSIFKPAAMRALLERHGFRVLTDGSVPELAASYGPEFLRAARTMKHMRMVTATLG